MTIEALFTQTGDTAGAIQWTTDDADPALGFDVAVNIDGAGLVPVATLPGSARIFADVRALWAPGDSIVYRVTDNTTTTFGETPAVIVNDLDLPFTYGPVVEATTIRYTTLDAVKDAIGIPLTNTDKDEQITEAAIAGESAIDRELGRSFPDSGSNPQIQAVPIAIANLAKKAAVAVYTGDHAPFGTAGSDEWMGAISVADAVSQTVRRSPLLRGYQVTFGFA